jgi:hypothetical protein
VMLSTYDLYEFVFARALCQVIGHVRVQLRSAVKIASILTDDGDTRHMDV